MDQRTRDWLRAGEAMRERAISECRDIDQQIAALESLREQRRAELAEVTRILDGSRIEATASLASERREASRVTVTSAAMADAFATRR